MQIRIGYDLSYECPQPTPMLLMLTTHFSRVSDLVAVDHMQTEPRVPQHGYRDRFGNWCTRIVAPQGTIRIFADGLINDSGRPEVQAGGGQAPIETLPEETMLFLLGSRYCETDRLSEMAWKRFGNGPTGAARVQAICDFVHNHVKFGYEFARSTKTAWDVYNEKAGVCRDFAHLAITLCRCMNIPARYCTGYLGDIGVPRDAAPMDFSGWFEVFLDGAWYTYDARHNTPRIGRVLMGVGRDATDVAFSTSFGPNKLTNFQVRTDEVVESNAGGLMVAHG
jgi:transglutaminase-like putative cysteine protease